MLIERWLVESRLLVLEKHHDKQMEHIHHFCMTFSITVFFKTLCKVMLRFSLSADFYRVINSVR